MVKQAYLTPTWNKYLKSKWGGLLQNLVRHGQGETNGREGGLGHAEQSVQGCKISVFCKSPPYLLSVF